MREIIETRELTKYYGKQRGIEQVNLSIREGELFGFIGPNGAGKSTAIRTILGLLSPTSGEVRLFDSVLTEKKQECMKRIGYMPSEASFYRGRKVKEILSYSARLRGRDCKAEAKKLCERFDLDGRKRVEELSLGNRKKVSIVCAMQHRPELCIFDEPTSGLDPLMQKEFFSLLRERNAEGATIFLSSHILGEIQKYCSRAAMIKDGRIIAMDQVERLCKTAAKRIALTGISTLPPLEGISGVEMTEGGLRFLYQGETAPLLKMLSELPIGDLSITEPDLEEIFLHFYQ